MKSPELTPKIGVAHYYLRLLRAGNQSDPQKIADWIRTVLQAHGHTFADLEEGFTEAHLNELVRQLWLKQAEHCLEWLRKPVEHRQPGSLQKTAAHILKVLGYAGATPEKIGTTHKELSSFAN